MASSSVWFPFRKPAPASTLRLFCFPFAGGGASAFRLWSARLPKSVEVCAVQYPGRDTRIAEPLVTQMDAMASVVAEAVAPLTEKPYAFFGHSLGAMLSFRVLRRLRASNVALPKAMVVSSCVAPRFSHVIRRLSGLPHDAFIDGLRKLNGTPPQVLAHAELMELYLPILRADFSVLETDVHKEEKPFDIPFCAYRGQLDADVSAEHLQGWKAETSANFHSRTFAGDHFYLQHDAELFRALPEDLGLD